jgi:GNAT superfamily N-acetyltransferase
MDYSIVRGRLIDLLSGSQASEIMKLRFDGRTSIKWMNSPRGHSIFTHKMWKTYHEGLDEVDAFVAYEGTKAIGLCLVWPDGRLRCGEWCDHLAAGFYVKRSRRRRGAARELMLAATRCHGTLTVCAHDNVSTAFFESQKSLGLDIEVR